MPRLFESSVEALLPNPIYLLLTLAVAATVGLFRRWPAPRQIALTTLLVWAYLTCTPGVSRLLIDQLESQYPVVDLKQVSGDYDVVVLASGGLESFQGQDVARLDAPAWERIHAAVRLWRVSGTGRLVVMGGPRSGPLSPSTAMADIAQEFGVPRGQIIVDDRANTTREGFEQFDASAVNLQPNSWLVTSAIHMPRSMLAAAGYGIELRPYPCDFIATDAPGWLQWIPSTLAYRLNIEILHEYVGLAAYRMHLGRISSMKPL